MKFEVMGFREGGGIIFVIHPDRVDVLSVPVRVTPDMPLEQIGTTNVEHLRVVATEILETLAE